MDKNEIMEAIKKMTVLELAELVKDLKKSLAFPLLLRGNGRHAGCWCCR